MKLKFSLASLTAGTVSAFQLSSNKPFTTQVRHPSCLQVAVDPTVVTNEEFQKIKGSTPTPEEAAKRLERNWYQRPRHVEVIEDISPIVDEMVENILLETGEPSWQPQDFVPDLTKETWLEEVKDFRAKAACVPDEVLVVLVGDMVTEEALPTYQTLLNTFEGCEDDTGATDTPWARWSRGWTSEENRHGDLLNRYLYLGGKCNMRSIEVTIQHLITNGFDPNAEQDPYKGFVYTSFQERATKVSHGNVGKLAKQSGDSNLHRICMKIAGDEARHEKAYQRFCSEILERDPNGLLRSFAEVMKGQIAMPAQQMTDGKDPKLYEHFAEVAQNLEVYTAIDYSEIIRYLVKTWDLENLTGLNDEGEKDRDYLCRLPDRYLKLAQRSMNRRKKAHEDEVTTRSFDWIYGREV